MHPTTFDVFLIGALFGALFVSIAVVSLIITNGPLGTKEQHEWRIQQQMSRITKGSFEKPSTGSNWRRHEP
jgi:hypothetical protein